MQLITKSTNPLTGQKEKEHEYTHILPLFKIKQIPGRKTSIHEELPDYMFPEHETRPDISFFDLRSNIMYIY